MPKPNTEDMQSGRDDRQKDLQKKKLYSLNLNQRQRDMLQDIGWELGLDKHSAIIADCIAFRHKKLFPVYKAPQVSAFDDGISPAERSVRRKANMKEAMNKEAERRMHDAAVGICDALGGVVSVDPGTGIEVCSWKTYNINQRYEQQVPLELLQEDTIKTQFYPDRKTVATHFPELNKKK